MSAVLTAPEIDQSIPLCLKELDQSEFPIPYRSRPIFGREGDARAWLREAVLQNEISDRSGEPLVTFEVAKVSPMSTRTLHRLSLPDSIEYYSIARRLAVRSASLQNSVSISFIPNSEPGPELWVDQIRAPYKRWRNFLAYIHSLCLRYGYCLSVDIEDFFNSILHEVLNESIINHYSEPFAGRVNELTWLTLRLIRLLTGWFTIPGSGIPQGPAASFFLAEIILLSIDFILDRPGKSVYRYVDDYRIFGNSDGNCTAQLDIIETEMGKLFLSLNKDKEELIDSGQMANRIARLDAFRGNFKQLTASDTLSVAVELLEEELNSDEFCRYCVNYLLAVIQHRLASNPWISDELCIKLANCFKLHKKLAANALKNWRAVLTAGIDIGQIQELFIGIVLSEQEALDTELALCYGSLRLVNQRHNQEMWEKLVEKLEADASYTVEEWSGSAASRIGKALLASIKHGRGNVILMDLYRKNNHYSEMRRYTAVAATGLPPHHQEEFFTIQRATCSSREELEAISYFQKYGEPLSPDRRMQPIHVGY